MKSDLDRLMAERRLDAFVVEGPDGLGHANPDFNYFVGGRGIPGRIFKKGGGPLTLIHSPWEAIQAAETGLALVRGDRWNYREILDQAPDRLAAAVEYRRRQFNDLGLGGRVGVYGTVPAGPHTAVYRQLERAVPGLEIVSEFDCDLISAARLTKDADEVEAMRQVGRLTCAVIQAVVDFIGRGRGRGGLVIGGDGKAITIGDVKGLIRRELAARNLEDPEGVIFTQGRDAGLPHAHGEDSAALRLGEAIVFDLFPRQQGGGYFHDVTRTFAIGHAPPELRRAYDDVRGAFEDVVGSFQVGTPAKAYQDRVCAYFAARGHETIATRYPIEEGYIHSLGHSLGLSVHEDWGFPSLKDRGDELLPGVVFTVEPGLYYPSRGYGIRIEDTLCCTPEGHFESLTPLPKELVIPLREG